MSDETYDYFGDPNAPRDIARSDTVVDDLFIETAAIRWFLRRDPEYHVIVGSKGTGKSLLLFKKAVLATKKSGIVVAPTPPRKAYAPGLAFADAERWVPYWPLSDSDGRPLLVQWAGLWEWALLVTICHAWRDYARRQGDQRLLSELNELLAGHAESSPFSMIAEALQAMATESGRVKGQARLPDQKPFRNFVLQHVGNLPPPYVFLDNQDDLFFDYPDFWTASGQGCFLAIQQLHESSNHRIHIFVTLRPEIIWELSKMQHFPQWTADIFRLQWRDDELIDVLRSRAAHLKRDLLPSPELLSEDPLNAFFGKQFYDERHEDFVIKVPLATRDGEEQEVVAVSDQLLRHSLRRPREMIILGNAILDARRGVEGCQVDPASVLRDAVDEKASNAIAKPYMAEVKHRWPWGSTPDQALRRFIVKWINKNVLDPDEVRAIEQSFADEESVTFDDTRPFIRLASLGLIGWPVEDPDSGAMTQHFVLPGEEDVDALPGDIQFFLVHPVLYAAPFHVQVVPGNVIGPRLPFDERSQIDPPQYHPAFLCCGREDRTFANRLRRDLQAHGVRCYFFVDGEEAGDDTWPMGREGLTRTSRLLVVCSVNGLESRTLLHTIDQQAGREPRRILSLSLDAEWGTDEFRIALGGRDLKPYLLRSSPIRFEEDEHYEDSLRVLLGKLEKRRRSSRPHGR